MLLPDGTALIRCDISASLDESGLTVDILARVPVFLGGPPLYTCMA